MTTFPKLQVKAVFQAKGEVAARKLAEELGIKPHRINRWIGTEWVALAPKPAKVVKAPKAEPATKAPAAKRKVAVPA